MDILVTRRLTLRPPLEVDAEAIAKSLQNTDVSRMLTQVPHPYSVQDALDWIQSDANSPTASHFSIYRQTLLGVVSVVEKQDNEPVLGYWLDKHFWGQGFISEATRAAVSHVFRKFGYSTIRSGAYEDNRGSLAVLEKLGFESDGTKSLYNPTRNCDVNCKQMILKRERFEQLFGSLDTDVAA